MDYHLDSRNNLEKKILCSVAGRRRTLFAVEISCREHEKNLRSMLLLIRLQAISDAIAAVVATPLHPDDTVVK
jgi:hypothetical protein